MTLDWVVGFYEGEGSCCILRNNGYPFVRITVASQNTPQVLEKIRDFLLTTYNIKVSLSASPNRIGGTIYQLYTQKTKEVFAFLDLIIPHLQSDKRKAQIDTVVREYVIERRATKLKIGEGYVEVEA